MNKFLAFVILLQLVGVGYFMLGDTGDADIKHEPAITQTEDSSAEAPKNSDAHPVGQTMPQTRHPQLWIDLPDITRKRVIALTKAGLIVKYELVLMEQAKSSDRMMANLAQAYLEIMRSGPEGERQTLEHLAQQYSKGSARNDATSTRQLAVAYAYGLGVPESQERAAELYEQAASLGDLQAKLALAQFTLGGRGTQQDFHKANRLFLELASLGVEGAEGYLAFIEREGLIGPRTESRYKNLLATADDPGSAKGLIYLGLLYGAERLVEEGFENSDAGLPETHLRTLIEIYNSLAAVNNPQGLMNLAFMLEKGAGVPANPQLALQYYHRSADLGNALAQTALAYHYRVGKFIPVDIAEAYFWSRLSENNGILSSKEVADGLRAQLSAAEITALETRIGLFKPVPST